MIPKSLSSRLLELALSVFAAAFLLNAAWKLVVPLLPFAIVLGVLVGLGLLVRGVITRGRYW